MNIRFQSIFFTKLRFFLQNLHFKNTRQEKGEKKSVEYERNRQLHKPDD